MEGKLPQYNTRIKLPLTQKVDVYDGKALPSIALFALNMLLTS